VLPAVGRVLRPARPDGAGQRVEWLGRDGAQPGRPVREPLDAVEHEVERAERRKHVDDGLLVDVLGVREPREHGDVGGDPEGSGGDVLPPELLHQRPHIGDGDDQGGAPWHARTVKRALLIINPYSTSVTGDAIRAVEEALGERVEVETCFTQRPGHASELAAGADTDAIVVFSGDGTYNEALNGADGARPFGFLPGGGTSVLPRALGLPRDPVEAARAVGAALAQGRTRRIGLGCVNGRRFSFSAGIGFDAEAVRRLDALGRGPGGARPGDGQFALMFARMVLERRGRWDAQLEIDGVGRAAFVLVANGYPYSYAGRLGIKIAPDARFDAGLDLVAPARVRRRDIPFLLQYVARGKGDLAKHGVYLRHDGDRFEVRCDRPLPLQADGEDLGDVEGAVFEAQRDAVSVLL
jgi:diacylglycerol kinase family enzyme